MEPGERYLERAVEMVRREALVGDLVDWDEVLADARHRGRGAPMPAAAYPAVTAVVGAVRALDQHSFFLSPAAVRALRTGGWPGLGLIALWPSCVVADVAPTGPAGRAGVRPGDVVRAVEGTPPTPSRRSGGRTVRWQGEPDDLAALADPGLLLAPRQPVRVQFARDGSERDVLLTPAPAAEPRVPFGRMLPGRVAYVWLPPVAGARSSVPRQAHDLLAALSAKQPRGWVIDLRGSTGGNMYPPLAGIGPVLGNGRVGRFVPPRDGSRWWSYRWGTAWTGWIPQARVPGRATRLRTANPPAAVLHGPITASAGEALAISFRGRPRTRSFGERTRGLTSANATIPLSDRAQLVLATAWEADRTDVVHRGPLDPDEPVAIDWATLGSDDDPVLAAARAWLT